MGRHTIPFSALVSFMTNQDQTAFDGGGQFATTHWSVVLAAAHSHDTRARTALESLCRTYWYPLYAFVRRQGTAPHDAQDLTQEFFARLLESGSLGRVDRAKGRFRSFLLASLKHFLANCRDHDRAQKRGGGQALLSFDAASAETRYALEPADLATPDKAYERQWALTLLDLVMGRLRAEHVAAGKLAQFDQLKGCLLGDKSLPAYAELAARQGVTESAIKMAVSRLRQRYRELIYEEIARTVSRPAEVEDEIRHLLAALGS
jgi:RNA polymerase sigma factor (sigma-70 family)